MFKDLQGYELTGADSESLPHFQRALSAFHLYHGDPLSLLESAIATSPGFSMAHIAKILMLALSSEPAAVAAAREVYTAGGELKLNAREQSLWGAAGLLLGGRWAEAGRAFDFHNMAFPLDLLGLQCGHLLDFYCADSRNLRERIARALPHWSEDIPGFSVVLGMYAFGLEEDGHYQRAEETGRQAVAMEPLDCWAHHAVAHVMEMQGRPEDGIGWMIAREAFWSQDDNAFKVHNWWHRAVFHLDLGQKEEALALYDGAVRETRSAVALDMVDASALLWRLNLAGVEAADRWNELAELWLLHADGQTYPFNDWHAAMAMLGSDRGSDLDALLGKLGTGAKQSPVGEWIQRIALPLVEGFAQFWRGDYRGAVDTLYPVRRIHGLFGGSHAQRDIIDLTLIEAARRGGLRDMGLALANERLALRPNSHMSRGFTSGFSGPQRSIATAAGGAGARAR